TRQKQARKRSLRAVNEHSEPVFNAVSATQVVFQRPANLFYPFAAPLQAWLNWAAGLMLLVHMGEALLFQARLQARPQPWLERMQVLLFGFLHLRGLPKA
ncbi:DUF1145 domain-containing protein, partial [Pseudomonas sp.]|uniref:DUF1145 domain-containing protein n=1 Tax=Pseudomonas sp. TaxID=306 RepID=UPI00273361FE